MKPSDPLDLLNEGFVDPAAPEELNPRLRGEEGLRLMQWLQAGGVSASLLRDVQVALRLQGEGFQATRNLSGLRDAVRSVIYARGFDAYPALSSLLHEALFRLSSWHQWEGFLRYLGWLAQVMLLSGTRDRA